MSTRTWLRILFGLSVAVDRRTYLLAGVLLTLLKIGIDNGLALVATGRPWPLLAYLAPSWTLKSEGIRGSPHSTPEWLLVALVVVALPFVWVGVTMSIRRAVDAGRSPFLGLLFLVPIVNYVVMIVLAALPSATARRWIPPTTAGVYRAPSKDGRNDPPPPSRPERELEPGVRATLFGMASSVGIGLGMIGLSVFSMGLYGAALFFATPLVMGLVTSFAYNMRVKRTVAASIGLALLTVLVTGSAVLLFAIEGLVCLVMAFPIAAVLAAAGAVLGWVLAQQSTARAGHAALSVLFLPGLATAEHRAAVPQLHEVSTAVEIDAPPEQVWPNVVGFSELPPPPEVYFRLGIAYPMRARIAGTGVGAVRRCEFSTGPFVEPITAWEPPRRLAFDVAAQPPSMTELSPYRNVRAAHLEGYMVSRRGEFRLVPLAGGRTRLEGSTWYTLAIFPEDYWTIWGEGLLHAIHGRVLAHIKRLSEASNQLK
jgi:hypothetical protein